MLWPTERYSGAGLLPTSTTGRLVPGGERQGEHDSRLDLDTEVGRKAHQLLKRRAVRALSIGYIVEEERLADDGANELLEIDLREISVVLTPANPAALVDSVKAEARRDGDEELETAKSAAPVELRLATFEVERR